MSVSAFPRLFCAAAVFCSAAPCAGCAQNQAPGASRVSYASPVSYDAANIARFSAPAAAAPSKRVRERAAALAQAHGYSFFVLAGRQPAQEAAARPHFSINYGRQPYGFGDAGAGPAASAGVSFPSAAGRPRRNGQTEWLVYMFRDAAPGSADIQAARRLCAPCSAAEVYEASAPLSPPVLLR